MEGDSQQPDANQSDGKQMSTDDAANGEIPIHDAWRQQPNLGARKDLDIRTFSRCQVPISCVPKHAALDLVSCHRTREGGRRTGNAMRQAVVRRIQSRCFIFREASDGCLPCIEGSRSQTVFLHTLLLLLLLFIATVRMLDRLRPSATLVTRHAKNNVERLPRY